MARTRRTSPTCTTRVSPSRPSCFRPEYAEQAANYCRLGATDADLADFFRVGIASPPQCRIRGLPIPNLQVADRREFSRSGLYLLQPTNEFFSRCLLLGGFTFGHIRCCVHRLPVAAHSTPKCTPRQRALRSGAMPSQEITSKPCWAIAPSRPAIVCTLDVALGGLRACRRQRHCWLHQRPANIAAPQSQWSRACWSRR
jgi:hypothetical protein